MCEVLYRVSGIHWRTGQKRMVKCQTLEQEKKDLVKGYERPHLKETWRIKYATGNLMLTRYAESKRIRGKQQETCLNNLCK